MRILVTGGAGFIGTNVILSAIERGHTVLNIDCLSYAGSLKNLISVESHPKYSFEKTDIRDQVKIHNILENFQPDYIFHLAAESHVDRSIDSAFTVLSSNIMGTCTLLDECSKYWIKKGRPNHFIFHHISTDEVFGSVKNDIKFNEETKYDPLNPYSVSKASSDHLVRSWINTHGIPAIITNCSNNYGSYQFPEKLIPLTITNALMHRKIPIYGDGKQIRDWIYVDDHVDALFLVLEKGKAGETYMIGSNNEYQNIDIVKKICKLLDEKVPSDRSYNTLIEYVTDRPGHDRRYAIDASKIRKQLLWNPQYNLEQGLEKTIDWYLENRQWAEDILKQHKSNVRLGKGYLG
tara:strand:+ start:135 stop:1181 length:1047 start_codon:yes stop_codon:yes gene_type:complete